MDVPRLQQMASGRADLGGPNAPRPHPGRLRGKAGQREGGIGEGRVPRNATHWRVTLSLGLSFQLLYVTNSVFLRGLRLVLLLATSC